MTLIEECRVMWPADDWVMDPCHGGARAASHEAGVVVTRAEDGSAYTVRAMASDFGPGEGATLALAKADLKAELMRAIVNAKSTLWEVFGEELDEARE